MHIAGSVDFKQTERVKCSGEEGYARGRKYFRFHFRSDKSKK